MCSNKRILPIALMLIFGLFGCSLDINEDPNNPVTATVKELLPNGQVTVIEPLANLFNAIGSSVVQTRVSTRHDNYSVAVASVTGVWNNQFYSGGLKDFQDVITQGTETEAWHYVGIAKLMKAYTFSIMVDVWNDLPYSDAFNPDLEQFGYDSGADIYNMLFALIEDGISDLSKTSSSSPGSDDVIYGGDLDKWRRMGNTLMLKMYNQIRLVDDGARAKIQELINAGNTIQSSADDFQISFGTSTAPENRHPLFVSDYVARLDNRISTYFGNLLMSNNDPRVPFYFFNQTPGTFVGRDAGNPDGLAQFEDQSTRTFHGAYPAGGAYDNGAGGATNADMGLKGAGTFRMMTNAMRIFIEAETVATLGVTGSMSLTELYEAGIRAAMAKVNEMGVGAISAADIDAYVQPRVDQFATASSEEQLRMIMMEKYILQFGNGIEQYNDWRRTGYPDDLTLVVQAGTVLNRFPYPSTENPPSRPNNDAMVFWDR